MSDTIPVQRSDSRWSLQLSGFPRDVWDQFKGSDLQSGYSFVYVWLANQFGHFMIGFAGLVLFAWICSIVSPAIVTSGGFLDRLVPAAALGAIWLGIWMLKELLIDITGALRDLRTAKLQRAALANGQALPAAPRRSMPRSDDLLPALSAVIQFAKKRPGRPDLLSGTAGQDAFFEATIVRDCLVDGWFYFAGVVTAVMMYAAPGLAISLELPWVGGVLPIAALVIVLVVSIGVSRRWLWEKVAFDKSMLPSVTRFALSMNPQDEAKRNEALAFGCSEASEGHLVIIGPPKSGRTSIAVAIGVEALLSSNDEHGNLLYTTLSRLLDRAAEEQQAVPESKLQGPPGNRPVWPPEEARLLIIDDISAQAHNGRSLLSPEAFADELRNNKAVLKKCRGKRVLWVVSDRPENAAAWSHAISVAFSLTAEVQVVGLNRIIDHAARLRPMRRAA